jgi:hypothetical protein
MFRTDITYSCGHKRSTAMTGLDPQKPFDKALEEAVLRLESQPCLECSQAQMQQTAAVEVRRTWWGHGALGASWPGWFILLYLWFVIRGCAS